VPAGAGLEVFVAFVLVGCLVGAVFAGRRLREIPMPDVRGRRVELAARVRALGEQEQPTDLDWRWLEHGLRRSGAGATAAGEVVTRVRERHEPPQDPGALLVEEIAAMFVDDPRFRLPSVGPAVVVVVGAGRGPSAASVGQLAHRLVADGRTVSVAAADADRHKVVAPWTTRAGADLILGGGSGSPVASAVQAARSRDVLILDGGSKRGQSPGGHEHLRRAVEAAAGRPADAVLLVLEAATVAHGLPQARQVARSAAATGVVLTGVDAASTRAAPLSAREGLGLPVWFLSTGEDIGDLAPFEPRAYAASLLR
jgi:fused signal recognition particle receptor